MNDSHIYGGSESSSEFWHIERPLACVILGLSFLIGVPGNLLVIVIILRHIKHRSHTVVLILNLAVCDFVVLVTLPVWIYSLADSWVFGKTFCKAIVYVIYSSMYGSVLLITLMSADRFVAIIYPFALQYWKKKGVLLKVLAVIWILAFLFGIPTILTQRVDDVDGKLQCTVREYTSDMQEVVCLVLETLVGFAIPFSVLSICYACVGRRIKQMTFKTKQKSASLIASVVIAFALCWFPHHMFNLMTVVSVLIRKSYPEAAVRLDEVAQTGVLVSGALAFISSCINPLLYAFAARRFRSSLSESGFRKLFHYITTSTSPERTNEMSFISRKQLSQTDHSVQSTPTV
ncbi:leukotriene B4 receptor 1-like [Acipenser oxyrinchus oxyrinchus]|uniref:Leukotriene B4 receptor 1-like n=1 Tax=Acipenser oxyrinchus oxyrinchus TaxID=40147 RepID=A0AAD8D3K8_ACIOX|nr:leukotriene B4 receptor 1-like [Acipenser oxyrinchus oxyrinchus]